MVSGLFELKFTVKEMSPEKYVKVSVGIRVKNANFLVRQLSSFYNIIYPSRHEINRSANEFGKFFEFRTAIILLHFV